MSKPRILIYHRVADDPIDAQLLCVSPTNFDDQLSVLSRLYRVVSLRRQIGEWQDGILPAGTVSLTFDDGYLDNLTAALPLLEKHRVHATIFVTSGMLGSQSGFWGDVVERILLTSVSLPARLQIADLVDTSTATAEETVRAHDELRRILRNLPAPKINEAVLKLQQWAGNEGCGPPERPVLNRFQLRRLAASPFIEIGAHTQSHTKLPLLSRKMQRAEIEGSRKELEQILGEPVRLFAYPYGSADAFNQDNLDIVRELGFDAGIANLQGDLDENSDLYALPRRLVRNWSKETFSKWMVAPDQSDAEATSLEERARRLLAIRQQSSPCHEAIPRLSARRTQGKSLSIVHINTYLGHGGAANSTLRLCRMQRADGHDSRVLAHRVDIDVDFAETFPALPDATLQAICLKEGYQDIELQGSHQLSVHPRIAAADVIHFQNLHGGYFNPLSIPLLSAVKPIVWTLRDMHSITGHCAHSLTCKRWRDGCHDCPDLHSYPPVQKDNCNTIWELKRLAYSHSHLQVVAPSKWIKKKAERGLLAEQPVELIYNGVDLDTFHPIDQTEARKLLGLPDKGTLIGMAADYGLANQYKGGDHFVRVARELKLRHPTLIFVAVGSKQGKPDFNSQGVLELPYLEDSRAMAAYYSALDFYLYTGIADTCPLVLIEAIACGLPVVGFGTGGVPEIARHEREGFIAPYLDEHALTAFAEKMILASKTDTELFRRSARKRAETVFDIQDMHARYLRIYERTIENWAKTNIPLLPVEELPDVAHSKELVDAVEGIRGQRRADRKANSLHKVGSGVNLNLSSLLSATKRLTEPFRQSRAPKLVTKGGRPYALYGQYDDGWMAPHGVIRVLDRKPRVLQLKVEIPDWLPFRFPVSLKAVLNEKEIVRLDCPAPGGYSLNVPLSGPGLIELTADQWLVPPEVTNDSRSLCYRVISVE